MRAIKWVANDEYLNRYILIGRVQDLARNAICSSIVMFRLTRNQGRSALPVLHVHLWWVMSSSGTAGVFSEARISAVPSVQAAGLSPRVGGHGIGSDRACGLNVCSKPCWL